VKSRARHGAVALRSLALLASLGVLGACGGSEPSGPDQEPTRTRLGSGAASVVIWRPPEQTRPTVVFLHGWGAVDPAAYGPWVRHLLSRGSAVVLPRYQVSAISLPTQALPNALRGVRAALDRVPGDWVAAGHSAGGALAADLAASAGDERLRRPRAVFAAYPGRGLEGLPFRIPARDPAEIPAETRVLAFAGARDRVAGQATARAIVDGAQQVPESRRRFVLVTRADAADHLAPQRGDRAAREVFWAPLDRLIEQVR
jgi:acetyl esterase/lipase